MITLCLFRLPGGNEHLRALAVAAALIPAWAGASEQSQVALRLINPCTQAESAPVIVNGAATVALDIEGAEPHARYSVTFRATPPERDRPALRETTLVTETGGEGVLRASVEWTDLPAPHQEATLLKLEAEWRIAGTSRILGSVGREAVQVASDQPRFYLHLSKPLCQKTSAWRPVSRYLFNRSSATLEIRHAADLPLTDPTRGLTLLDESTPELRNPNADDLPLTARPRPYFGWSFAGWEAVEKIPGENQSEFRWSLLQNHGGFVGQAWKRIRFAAEEFVYSADPSQPACGTWSSHRYGELEVSRPTYQLLLVPEAQQRSSHELERYLELAYSAKDTCQGEGEDPNHFESIPASGSANYSIHFREH